MQACIIRFYHKQEYTGAHIATDQLGQWGIHSLHTSPTELEANDQAKKFKRNNCLQTRTLKTSKANNRIDVQSAAQP